MIQHVTRVTLGHTLNNLLIALLGNGVDAGVFVAGAYWFLYLKGTPPTPVPDAPTGPDESPTSTPIHDNA